MHKLEEIQWGWEFIINDEVFDITLFESIYNRGSYRMIIKGEEILIKEGDWFDLHTIAKETVLQLDEIYIDKNDVVMCNLTVIGIDEVETKDNIVELNSAMGVIIDDISKVNIIDDIIVRDLLNDINIYIDMNYTDEQKINILNINLEEIKSETYNLVSTRLDIYEFWIKHLCDMEKYEECHMLNINKELLINN